MIKLCMETILSLDIATNTGYCYFNGKDYFYGYITIPKSCKTSWQKFKYFKEWLAEFIDTEKPGFVVVEQPFFRGLDGSALLLGLYTIAKTEAKSRNIKFDRVSISTIKKFLTKDGKASKMQMVEAVEKLGYKVERDDEADAIALNLYYQSKLRGKNDTTTISKKSK